MNKINKSKLIAGVVVGALAAYMLLASVWLPKAKGAIITNIFVQTSAGGTVTNGGIITNYLYTPYNNEVPLQTLIYTNITTNSVVAGITNGILTNVYTMVSVTPGLFAQGNAYTLGGKYTPLSFFGTTPTNQPTVALVTNLAGTVSSAETTGMVNQINALITALKQLGLAK